MGKAFFKSHQGLVVGLIAFLFLFFFSEPTLAATITVNSYQIDQRVYQFNSDTQQWTQVFVPNGVCTLSEAIYAANTDTAQGDCPAGSGPDTIQLATGSYSLLAYYSASTSSGLPNITSEITINGGSENADDTIIERNLTATANFGFFYIGSTGNLTLNQIKFTNGNTTTLGGINVSGGILNTNNCILINNHSTRADFGAGIGVSNGGTANINTTTLTGNTASAIYIQNGTVAVNNSTLSNNTTTYKGAAIQNSGNLTVSNSVFLNNSIATTDQFGHFGGAIYNLASLNIESSVFSGNQSHSGGAIYTGGTNANLTIDGSSFSNNQSTTNIGGGAIRIFGSATTTVITNSTFANNQATDINQTGQGNGGAIYTTDNTQLTNVTLTGNTANNGGGLYSYFASSIDGLHLKNVILQGNTATILGQNCFGSINSLGNNIFTSGNPDPNCTINNTRPSDIFAAAGLAEMVTDSQGQVAFPLLATSPAINAGINVFSEVLLQQDQLDTLPVNARDIGAVEYACGNGTASIAEVCDDGNTDNTDLCTTLCQLPTCGDGYTQPSNEEDCDDGNTQNGDGCNSTCQNEICGDGVTQQSLDEDCDDGNTQNGDGCSSTCMMETICGNALVEGVEQCDDGNVLPQDGCSDICQDEICGDGITQQALDEDCDDGNLQNGDGCDSACQQEYCGDGILHDILGETCDDGNTQNGDGCNSTCQNEVCGDGVLHTGLLEQCDDGNTQGGDGCNSTCRNEVCGDGVWQSYLDEECDDGNASNNDYCLATCFYNICGDGILRDGLEIDAEDREECDDNNTQNGDGCSENCTVEILPPLALNSNQPETIPVPVPVENTINQQSNNNSSTPVPVVTPSVPANANTAAPTSSPPVPNSLEGINQESVVESIDVESIEIPADNSAATEELGVVSTTDPSPKEDFDNNEEGFDNNEEGFDNNEEGFDNNEEDFDNSTENSEIPPLTETSELSQANRTSSGCHLNPQHQPSIPQTKNAMLFALAGMLFLWAVVRQKTQKYHR